MGSRTANTAHKLNTEDATPLVVQGVEMEDRLGRLELAVEGVTAAVAESRDDIKALCKAVGHAADPISGVEEAGLVGAVTKLTNHVMTGSTRSALEFLIDDDESDDTASMARPDLVKAKREYSQKFRLALLGAGVTLITTAGTVITVWLTKG